jgi:hypothetical protein
MVLSLGVAWRALPASCSLIRVYAFFGKSRMDLAAPRRQSAQVSDFAKMIALRQNGNANQRGDTRRMTIFDNSNYSVLICCPN